VGDETFKFISEPSVQLSSLLLEVDKECFDYTGPQVLTAVAMKKSFTFWAGEPAKQETARSGQPSAYCLIHAVS
jgi:hypothetical protein